MYLLMHINYINIDTYDCSHSSQFQGLCSIDLPYFWNKKTQIFFNSYFRFVYIWQILKPFSGAFHRAPTLKLLGMIYVLYLSSQTFFQIFSNF